MAERVYPSGTPAVPLEEARRSRAERRLRSLGIVRATAAGTPSELLAVVDIGEPATVEGVPGVWWVDPEALEQLGRPFIGRTGFLSPCDRLVHDRVRAAELFEFDYVLEMYKLKAQRRWGYVALPILHGDRLVGRSMLRRIGGAACSSCTPSTKTSRSLVP